MFEKALSGSRRYWGWITLLAVISVVGFIFYLWQWSYGLGITGMSRDVSWGLYIANFTFFVKSRDNSDHSLFLCFRHLHTFLVPMHIGRTIPFFRKPHPMFSQAFLNSIPLFRHIHFNPFLSPFQAFFKWYFSPETQCLNLGSIRYRP